MNPENEQFLKNNLHHFITLERAFYLRGLNVHEKGGMERVMEAEFAKGYRADLTCDTCVADMVTLLYRSYFNYLKAKHQDDTVYKDTSEGIEQLMNRVVGVEEEMESEPVAGIQIHASFPSNLPEVKVKNKGGRPRKIKPEPKVMIIDGKQVEVTE